MPIRAGSTYVPQRLGNRQPMSFGLSGIFQSKDGRWITYSCATFPTARRLLTLIGANDFLDNPECGTLLSLSQHDEEINERVKSWMAERTASEVLKEFEKASAVAAMIYDTDDILSDEHIRARGNVVEMPGEKAKVVNVVPQMGATPGKVRWLGRPEIGADTVEVLRNIGGFDDAEIRNLEECGAIAVAGRKGAR